MQELYGGKEMIEMRWIYVNRNEMPNTGCISMGPGLLMKLQYRQLKPTTSEERIGPMEWSEWADVPHANYG